MTLPSMPELPRPATRPPFPVLVVVAPMVGAVVIGLVLGSPFMLLFALLGPIVAVAGVLDARRSVRRQVRAEAQRFDRECALFEQAIEAAHRAERRAAHCRFPPPAHGLFRVAVGDPLRIGTAEGASAVVTETVNLIGDSDGDRRRRQMLARAQQNPELPALVGRGHIVIEGDGIVAEVLARRLACEAGVSVTRAPRESDGGARGVMPVEATWVSVRSATEIEVRAPGATSRRVRPEFVTERQIDSARRQALPSEAVPRFVAWSAVEEWVDPDVDGGGIPIGVGETGIVTIDLIAAGPHALVGGTTGSGKSELLRSLALGWAATSAPSSAQLLFIDFKGGATFAHLTDLPHAIGLVTDLDPIVAQRAMRSLRAELRDREQALIDAGLRDIREQPDLLPRLLVLVDEFATLAASFPELHAVFSDIAARGRSLGVHLVLCTQHPTSAVRDSIAANCPVRLSFRVTDASAGGIIGDRARELIAAPPGRAMLVDERGTRPVQVAVVADDDVDRVIERWRSHPAGRSTWCPPLPDRLSAQDIPSSTSGARAEGAHTAPGRVERITFGLLDDPDEGARYAAEWNPPRDGALAVLGASSSGRSTLLATLAAGAPAHARVVVLPGRVPEAWQVLEQISIEARAHVVLLCDGLDALLAAAGDRSNELLVRWDSAVRTVRAHGGAAAASVAASRSGSSLLAGRFESRVVLRCADADEHAMAGAPRALFDRRAPAGRGWWRDLQVQVIDPMVALPDPENAPAPEWQPPPDQNVVVIASQADDLVGRISTVGLPHRVVRDVVSADALSIDPANGVALDPVIYVATPAQWQTAWSFLSAARPRLPVALVNVDESDLRGLLGHREPAPPIDATQGEIWVVTPTRSLTRVVWNLASDETGVAGSRPS